MVPAPPSVLLCLKRPRVTQGDKLLFGPGKADLLQAVIDHGSISAAARAMRMSYRRAWLLLDDLHKTFGQPLVSTATGGSGGGGARVTAHGRAVLAGYRELEATCAAAAAQPLLRLQRLVATAEPTTEPAADTVD